MKARSNKFTPKLIQLIGLIIAMTQLTAYSQSTSKAKCDTMKCFTYQQAEQIIKDLQKCDLIKQESQLKDTIIQAKDSIIVLRDETIELERTKNKKVKRNVLIGTGSGFVVGVCVGVIIDRFATK